MGYDSKDGVVLIFLLAIFTLTSERGGKLAGIKIFQSFHSRENNFSLSFFKLEFFLTSSSHVHFKIVVEATGSGHSLLLHHIQIEVL